MEYGIRELSALAGVSPRTLRYYDEIGLLKPSRVTEAGYRYYGQAEVELLQQILFYRARGFELKTIEKMLRDRNFDRLKAMEDHLRALEKQKAQTEELIRSVKTTIRYLRGECEMDDRERFQALKDSAIRENETRYGAEARQRYGDDAVSGANRLIEQLTPEQYERWKTLETEILNRLERAVAGGVSADSSEAKEIAGLHKDWLSVTLPRYSPQIHRGIAAMYIADERFTRYYDRTLEGCAQLLPDAVQHWISA